MPGNKPSKGTGTFATFTRTTKPPPTSTSAAKYLSGPNAARTGNSPPFISTWEFNNLAALAKPPQLNPDGSHMTVRDQCNARFRAWNDTQDAEPQLSAADFEGVVHLPDTPGLSSSSATAVSGDSQLSSSDWSSPPEPPLLVSRWSADSSLLEATSPVLSQSGKFHRFVDVVKHGRKPSRQHKSPAQPNLLSPRSDKAAGIYPVSPGFAAIDAVPLEVAQANVSRYGRSGVLGSPHKCVPTPRDAVGEVLANGTVLVPLATAQADAAAYGRPDFAIDVPLGRKWSSTASSTSAVQASFTAERPNEAATLGEDVVQAAGRSTRATKFAKFKQAAKFVLTRGDAANTPEFTMVAPRPQPARIVVGDADHSTIFGDFIDAANRAYKHHSPAEHDTQPRSTRRRGQIKMPAAVGDAERLIAPPPPSVPNLTHQPLRARRQPRFDKALPPVPGQDLALSERAESCVASLQDMSSELESAISSWSDGSFSARSAVSDGESDSEGSSRQSSYDATFRSHADPSSQIPESTWNNTLHLEAARLKAVLQRPAPGIDAEPAITIDVDFQDGKTVWLVTERAGADTVDSYRNRYTTVVPDSVTDVAEATELLRRLLELGL